jgi:hypothetical protein
VSAIPDGDRQSAGPPTPRPIWIWSPALAGPVAWFLDLNTRYFLVESGVAARHPIAIPCIGLVYLLIAGAASAAGWRRYRQLAQHAHGARFVVLLGCVLSGYAALVILAMLLPHLFYDGSARI